MIAARLMEISTLFARRPAFQRYDELAYRLLRSPLTIPKEVIAICALQCSGQWDPTVDEDPCGEAATSSSAVTSLDSADSTWDRMSHDGSTSLDKHVDNSSLDGNRRSITSTRTARSARRAAVAANKDVRNAVSASSETAVHMRPGSNKDSSRKARVVIPQQKARPPDTPDPKSASALSRSPTLPTWMPSSCGASGSSCGGGSAGPGSGNVLERKVGAEQEDLASSPPHAIKREAEPHAAAEAHPLAADHPSGWVPSSCGYSGGTCGGADGSGGTVMEREMHAVKPKAKPPPATDPRKLAEHPTGWSPSSCGFSGSTCGGGSGSGSGPASMPPLYVTKRETESQPVAEARRSDDHPPGWTPMSCTINGVTCGKKDDIGKGTADANANNGPPAPYRDD